MNNLSRRFFYFFFVDFKIMIISVFVYHLFLNLLWEFFQNLLQNMVSFERKLIELFLEARNRFNLFFEDFLVHFQDFWIFPDFISKWELALLPNGLNSKNVIFIDFQKLMSNVYFSWKWVLFIN